MPHDSFPADCSICHEGGDWLSIKTNFAFDHEGETGVPLEGAHAAAECLRCHNDRGPAAIFAAKGCAGCHEDVHRSQLGEDCESCHNQSEWRPKEQIALHNRTGFPLIGAHASTACWRCHEGAAAGSFTRTDTECISCHAADLARASDPDHVAQGWTADCDRCHIPTSWEGADFNHGTFPLVGRHASVDCAQCHVGGVFAGTPTECFDCHLADYQGTTDPDHAAALLPTSCESCHTASGWENANFDHNSWPLTGSHRSTSCAECHVGNVFVGTPNMCADCHLTDYQAATDPDHGDLGFPLSCDECHSTSGWGGAEFDHTSWPLTGSHRSTSCSECHVGNVYIGTPTMCADCHQTDYDTTTDPNHLALGFPTSCDECHSTTGWDGADFGHQSWPLTGSHLATSCNACHVGGVFVGTPNMCADCHLSEYEATTDPAHVAAGFPTACDACHSTAGWGVANFDHQSWPLTGSHVSASCTDCHANNVFIGTPNMCVDCHLTDYQATTDPDHLAAGFPTSCDTCHSTVGWGGANFNHSFPINNGPHKRLDCADCHLVSTNFQSFSCTDCHEHERGQTDDDHSEVSGYVYLSSACLSCHPSGD